MPKARCKDCGELVHWPGGAGQRMANYRCHHCGGELKGLGGRKGAGKRCVVCGEQLVHGLIPAPLRGAVYYKGRSIEVAFRDPICWHGHGLV